MPSLNGPSAMQPGLHWRVPQGAALLYTLLAIICFLPTLTFYLFASTASVTGFNTTSHATGSVIACVTAGILYTATPAHIRPLLALERWLLSVAIIALLIAAHLLVASLFNVLSLGRAGSSLLGLVSLAAGAYFVYATILRSSDAALQAAAGYIRLTFLAMAMLSLAGIQPPGAGELISSEKSVFPFSEPSHFAITFMPFLVHGAVVNTGWRQLAWIAVGLALGYILQNFTLVIGTALAAALSLPVSRLMVAGGALIAAIGVLDIEYFTARLDFSFESQNMSSLVYRQGWELAADALSRTDGWGIGFQQLGFVPFNSPTADMVYRLLFNDANIKDGGFLVAKLVAEMGAFGIAVVAAYLVLLIRIGWRLRTRIFRSRTIPPKILFGYAVVCGFVVEMFVRGLGYFTGSVVLMLSAALIVWTARRSRTVNATRTQVPA